MDFIPLTSTQYVAQRNRIYEVKIKCSLNGVKNFELTNPDSFGSISAEMPWCGWKRVYEIIPLNIKERSQCRWGGLIACGRMSNVDIRICIYHFDCIKIWYFLPYLPLQPLGYFFPLINDNIRCQTLQLVDNMLETENAQSIKWTACALHFNSDRTCLTENLMIHCRETNASDDCLVITALEAWYIISLCLINNLIASIKNRSVICLAVRGNTTLY